NRRSPYLRTIGADHGVKSAAARTHAWPAISNSSMLRRSLRRPLAAVSDIFLVQRREKTVAPPNTPQVSSAKRKIVVKLPPSPGDTHDAQEQRRTQVTSHEFAEMVTDPHFPDGWFGPSSDENGDICNGESDFIVVGPNTWDVQRQYSKHDDIATNGASFCIT